MARVFKTAWFAKAAGKARIGDAELCQAIAQAMLGQADDLGGGVYKKRLNRNDHRSIILAKGVRFWVFEYLFAKKDRADINAGELMDFRQIAKGYERVTDRQMDELIRDRHFLEICHDGKAQI